MAVPVVQFADAQLYFLDEKGSRALLTFRPGARLPVAPDGTIELFAPNAVLSLRIVKHIRSSARTSRYSRQHRFSPRLLVEVLESRPHVAIPSEAAT